MASARIDLVCYFVTIFIARSYCASFRRSQHAASQATADVVVTPVYTLKRRARIRKARSRSRSGGSSSSGNRGVFSKGTDRRGNFGTSTGTHDRMPKEGTVIALGDMGGGFREGPVGSGVIVETHHESRSEGVEGKDTAGPRMLHPYGLDV